MIVNEGTETYCGEMELDEQRICYRYDAWENKIRPVEMTGNRVVITVEPLKSFLLIADATLTSSEELEQLSSYDEGYTDWNIVSEETLVTGWKRSIIRSIAYPAFEDEKTVDLPDHLEEELPEFSGFVRYETGIEASKEDHLQLRITDASEGVEVFVNGESIGIQIVPEYRFDLAGHLKDGMNEIRIEVATTLERETAKIPDPLGKVNDATCKSGITGTVKLIKFEA